MRYDRGTTLSELPGAGTAASEASTPAWTPPDEPSKGIRTAPPPTTAPSTGADAASPLRRPESPDGLTAVPVKRRIKYRLTRRRLIWVAALVALALLIALALRPTPLEVEVGEVVRGALETTVDAEGVTRLRDRYQVAAPVSGRLERIALREGDPVEAGAVLARIAPLPLDPQATQQARARLSAAQAAQQEAEARLVQMREASEQAERTTARIREVATAGAMSVEALERAELQLASALRDYQAAQARVRAASAETAAARASLLSVEPDPGGGQAAVIRSPSSGRVLRVHEPSERVVAAGTPLVELGDATGLEVVVDVLSTDAVKIRPGATMRLIEWGGSEDLQARVRLVEPAGFTKVSTLGVEEQRVNVIGDLDAAPAALGHGYRVEARIITWLDPDVVRVPNSALFRRGDGWGVFVVEGSRAHLRMVRVGHRGAAATEVLEGLSPGESVLLFPSDRVDDGARVKVAPRG